MLLYTSLIHRDEALSNPSLDDGTVVNVDSPLHNEEDSSTVMLDRMLQKVGDRMDETKHTGDKITESVTENEMCKDRMTYQKTSIVYPLLWIRCGSKFNRRESKFPRIFGLGSQNASIFGPPGPFKGGSIHSTTPY